MKVFILAGTYIQAQYIAKHQLGLKRDEWRAVDRADMLQGVRGEDACHWIGGTFWERRDAHEVWAMVQMRELPKYRPSAEITQV